jgi:hypothetical protein
MSDQTTIPFDRQVWSDYLNWGGIAGEAWETTFRVYGEELAKGLIPLQGRYDRAAYLMARNYEYLADRVTMWAANAQDANGSRAQAYAEALRSDYAAKAQALSDTKVDAAQRLASASANVESSLGRLAPQFARYVGSAFDWIQVIDAVGQGDLAGVYANMAQMLAAEAAAALVVALAPAWAPALGVAVAAGALAGFVAWAGSDKGWGFYGDFGRWLEPYAKAFGLEVGGLLPSIPEWIKTLFETMIYETSPLVLDLDGDGIEISQLETITPTFTTRTQRIYFDHDGDGIQSNGAWLQGDDGFLALDKNANGQIDNGFELFGNNTRLANGQTAADGFAAFAEQDTNADGMVNALDANWNNLRVWRDRNQDGISQAEELSTLNALGITQINTAQGARHEELFDGTRLEGAGTFVMNGHSANFTDAWFSQDSFHGRAVAPIALAADVQGLPDMGGSGAVRSLHEAATLSPALKGLLVQFGQASTPAQRRGLARANCAGLGRHQHHGDLRDV